MIVATLIILGASLTFVVIALVAVVLCLVLPMREQIAKQNETIERNVGATIGLYAAHQRRLNALSDKVGAVEEDARPTIPDVEAAPITVRSERERVAA